MQSGNESVSAIVNRNDHSTMEAASIDIPVICGLLAGQADVMRWDWLSPEPIVPVQSNPLRCLCVEVRSLRVGILVSDVRPAHVIDHKEDDVRPRRSGPRQSRRQQGWTLRERRGNACHRSKDEQSNWRE